MPYYVYIMTNEWNTVLYTGVTNDIDRRVREHRAGTVDGFTRRYRVHKLVYAEVFAYVHEALEAEKRIKGWRRSKKVDLIEGLNPKWRDLEPVEIPRVARNDRPGVVHG